MERVGIPVRFARASQDIPSSQDWLRREWDEARTLAAQGPALLVVDEVQMVHQWSAVVKALWDADTDHSAELAVVLTGSPSLLLQKGMRESLTGRFDVIPCQQWYFRECEEAFGFSLEDYLCFGGYPARLRSRATRSAGSTTCRAPSSRRAYSRTSWRSTA